MSIKLIQITDCHLGSKTPPGFEHSAEQRLSAVVQALLSESDIDHLLLTGDLAQFGEQSQYDALATLLAPLQAPQHWIAGNHDEAAFLTDKPCFNQRVISLGDGWGLILLNSIDDRDGKGSGSLGVAERAWLNETLLCTQGRFDHLLLAVHHPPVAVGSAWQDAISLGDSDLFAEGIEKDDRIRGILCGHLHQEHSLTFANTKVWVTPATAHQYVAYTATPVRDHDPVTGLPAYRVILLNTDGQIKTWVERVPLA
jgi:Icc protein